MRVLCSMNYTEHKDNPKSFRALTGLDHIQFSHLLPYFEAAHDDYLSEYDLTGKRRSNRRSFCIYSISAVRAGNVCEMFVCPCP